MQKRSDLIVCEKCDAVYRKTVLAPGEIARCKRCNAELDRHMGNRLRRLLPLTIASLIMFFVANCFPIVEIELQGLSNQTTLMGAVLALSKEGMSLVAVLVMATTILFPLMQLLILLYILMAFPFRGRLPGTLTLLRMLQIANPWGMVEVFLLGVLVALVKLSHLANVLPGIALWAFGILTVLLTVVVSFNPRYLWHVFLSPHNGSCGEAE